MVVIIMKILYILITLICFSGMATAAQDVTNITNIVMEITPETVGGTNVVTLHPHYVDHWFAVYNDGSITYQVYAYDYVGVHDPPYKAAFIGAIEPNQMGVLNSNASYYLYADYDDIQDLGSLETVEKRFNQYWFIIIVGLIMIIGLYYLYRTVRYK
jgi:phosphate/sulfate permease